MKKQPLLMTAAAMLAALAVTACSAGTGSVQTTTGAAETTAAETTAPAETEASSELPKLQSISIPDYSVPEITFETFAPATLATLAVPDYSLPKINVEIGEGVTFNSYVSLDSRGAISLDNSVLFSYDSAELSNKGKESIKSFLADYVKQIFNSDGTAKVKKITVEGHTDTDGSREYNQKLSEQRAKAVMDYCNQIHPELKPYLVSKGCASDYPVLKSDGTVDMDASRRVCFVAE